MAKSANTQSILYGAPFCWVMGLDVTDPDGVTDLWTFGNLAANPVYKLLAGAAATGTGENLDVTRADKAIIRYPLYSPIIDGTDDTKNVASATGSDASGYGEITIIINESYIGATSWTKFIDDVKAKKLAGEKFLIILPTGYSFDRTGAFNSVNAKPDGYVYMIGNISNDVEQTIQAGGVTTLTLTFQSQLATNWTPTAPLSFNGKGIEVKRGATVISALNNVPIDLASGDLTDLAAGKVVLKEVAAV